MQNKKIIAFFETAQAKDYLEHKGDYFAAYQEFASEIESRGGELWITGSQENYLGNKVFKNVWRVTQGQLIEQDRVEADVVFDKGRFETDGAIAVFNKPFINELCTNKWETYQRFSQFCPLTLLVNNIDELTSSLDQIPTDIVVLKPVAGSEGKEVFIGQKTEVPTTLSFPLLVSEFVDSSGGIPNIIDGKHDFRIAVLNGEIIYSYYRTPPAGSLIANVSRGGSFATIDTSLIPEEALTIVRAVDSVMSVCPKRFYGVDVMFSEHGPKITELNSRLGLLPNKDGADFPILKKKLAETLLNLELEK